MKNSLLLKGGALAILTATLNSAIAGVYVSTDSITPTSDHKLKQAHIQALEGQTEAIIRQSLVTESIMGELIDYNKATQRRADAKYEEAVRKQEVLNLQHADLLTQQNQLFSEKNKLDQTRIALYKDYETKNADMHRKNALTQKAIYEEQNRREQAFLTKQSEVQKATLDLQLAVNRQSEDLLREQLSDNAPSNVVVASRDASNLKAKVKPQDVDELSALSQTKKQPPLVNMNTFIGSILPKGWEYTPPKNSSNKRITLVQGKDWKSIINQIAIEHPYYEFFIDPYKKTLSARQMYQPQAPKQRDYVRAWHINPTRSLKETVEHFASISGWKVIWDTQDIDYPIVAEAVVNADFAGKTGIINRLIKSTQQKDFPLVAQWHEGNQVILVTRRGSDKK